jgi:spermidine synthase
MDRLYSYILCQSVIHKFHPTRLYKFFTVSTLNLNSDFTHADLLLGLIGIVLAVWFGAYLAKKQARAYRAQPHNSIHSDASDADHLPEVTFADYGDMRFLHLGTPAVQGSMKLSKPVEIHLEYVQRMMAWLLFVDLNQVHQLHAMQMGLGAASLTKFCFQQLQMQTTAVELNPKVIIACKRWFYLPENNDRLQVLHADAAQIACDEHWQEKIDVLHVDLYDSEAASPVLDSEAFYRNCRGLLTQQGCMVVNLFGHAHHLEESLKNITHAYGESAVWIFKPTSSGNTIVLAFRSPRVIDEATLAAQAQTIQARWSLPAQKWLKVLRAYSENSSGSASQT